METEIRDRETDCKGLKDAVQRVAKEWEENLNKKGPQKFFEVLGKEMCTINSICVPGNGNLNSKIKQYWSGIGREILESVG